MPNSPDPTCQNCGGPLPKSRQAVRKFCSQECRYAFHKGLRAELIANKNGVVSLGVEVQALWNDLMDVLRKHRDLVVQITRKEVDPPDEKN